MVVKRDLILSKDFIIISIRKKRYLVSEGNGNFVKVPWYITVMYADGKLHLASDLNFKAARVAMRSIEFFCSKADFPYARKLVFRGLGLKFGLINDLRTLELKLGFSHLIRLNIPREKIQVKAFKTSIVVLCSNLVSLKNFMYKIKRLRAPNIYKGKGIWYKNEKKVKSNKKKN